MSPAPPKNGEVTAGGGGGCSSNDGGAATTAPRLSCTKCFDALWFCYSPVHQMQQYYRRGEFDTCFDKWTALFDCLKLKTKKSSEVQIISPGMKRWGGIAEVNSKDLVISDPGGLRGFVRVVEASDIFPDDESKIFIDHIPCF